MRVIHAPEATPALHEMRGREVVFLAGSIEMGKATDWQADFVGGFENTETIFLNPRRKFWDASWTQDISNPQFNEQVNWELDSLALSTTAVFYFQPGTMSPISLLEFGLTVKSGKCLVCCPTGFWRRGNVEIVCRRENVFFTDSIDVIKEMTLRRVLSKNQNHNQ